MGSSASFHQVMVIGNLGKDPEMRFTPNGAAVTNFSVATNRTYTDAANKQITETAWWRISTWGKQAEACNNFLQKGSKVMVIGHVKPDKRGNPRTWTSQDSTTNASYELDAETVKFLSSRDGADHTSDNGSDMEGNTPSEDIPF
jgi:single-strand DNA-binding protein